MSPFNIVFFKDTARQMLGAYLVATYFRNKRSRKWTMKTFNKEILSMFPSQMSNWTKEKSETLDVLYSQWLIDEAMKK